MPLGNATSLLDSTREVVGNVMTYFVTFGQEIGIFEQVFLETIVIGVGILISASAVIDLTRMKNPRYQNRTSPASVAIRFVIGPATIQLVALVRAVAGSIFGDSMANQASMSSLSYVQNASNADPTAALLLTLVGFLIFVGWVSALRAMVAFSRLGNPQENGYHLFRTGAARLIAATCLCMFQFVMDDLIESFTGQGGVFSSNLNL